MLIGNGEFDGSDDGSAHQSRRTVESGSQTGQQSFGISQRELAQTFGDDVAGPFLAALAVTEEQIPDLRHKGPQLGSGFGAQRQRSDDFFQRVQQQILTPRLRFDLSQDEGQKSR